MNAPLRKRTAEHPVLVARKRQPAGGTGIISTVDMRGMLLWIERLRTATREPSDVATDRETVVAVTLDP